MNRTRKRTTIYLDADLLRAAQELAASTGRHDYEVFEEALRRYLSDSASAMGPVALRDLLDRFATRADLDDEEAMRLANSEVHAARAARPRP